MNLVGLDEPSLDLVIIVRLQAVIGMLFGRTGLARSLYSVEELLKLSRLFLLSGMTIAIAGQANALTITRNFTGGTASANVSGTGTLQTLFNAAADVWEAAILDSHNLTLNYSWSNLGSGTLGQHSMGTQGGAPHRETSGTIQFSNNSGIDWFMDSTPFNHSEYTTFTASTANLGGGVVNTGRVYTGSTGLAVGNTDMMSVMLHEIGHALGMSSANTAWQGETGDGDVDVQAPRPFAGTVIPMVSGAHINIGTSLMFPSIGTDTRRWISAVDILANAEVSNFTDLNLNPVPEPATMVMAGLGLAAIIRRKRSVRK